MTELKLICDSALSNPDFKPKSVTTHCNEAVNQISKAVGCNEFEGLMADGICQNMASNVSGKWARVDPSDATIWALSNGLAIAAMSSVRLGESHGHVAVVYPMGMQNSPSFGRDVPVLANVGKKVGVMKSSEAFPIAKGEPDYYTYSG